MPSSVSTQAIPNDKPKHVIGVCTMDKKARSQPMRQILNRLLCFEQFEVIVFGDKTILDEDVEHWPICDFLICYFSKGFPLDKAKRYIQLHQPFTINDVYMQSLLWDRRIVLAILDAIGVPTPPRLVVSRDGGVQVDPEAARAFQNINHGMNLQCIIEKYTTNTEHVQVSKEGTVQVGNVVLKKPFLEKPVNSEDHNINIYLNNEQGGGGRHLFRKVGNKSSEFDANLNIPASEGSWIYESVIQSENSEDVKIYTVGSTYIHAETRKSPTVDGIVKRNTDGREIRRVTELTAEERAIAVKISSTFGQMICGLDLLRVQGKSYVIDVNGWSFNKRQDEYYDRCAKIMYQAFINHPTSLPRAIHHHSWRLKGFAAVLRHGDRTPKNKYKISLMAQPFVDLLNHSTQECVFRQKHQLQLVKDAIEKCLEQRIENREKLRALKEILDRKGDLAGTKVQVKPIFDKDSNMLRKLQVNVKWGGEFTHAGLHQTRDLGENLRKDMNILNKHITKDINIWSSSERRVRATADAFTHSFLGDVSSVLVKESKYLLDDSNAAKEQMDAVKKQLRAMFRPNHNIPTTLLDQLGWSSQLPQPSQLLEEVSAIMSRLRTVMRLNWDTKRKEIDDFQWCCFESPTLFKERWESLFNKFCTGDTSTQIEEDTTTTSESDTKKIRHHHVGLPDLSGIPDLYDSLKYDALHNRQFLETIFKEPDEEENSDFYHLYTYVRALYNFVAPQEYGIIDSEKKQIGMLIGLPLLKQILRDLEDFKEAEQPKTSLYFTKESHVHALLNLVYLSGMPIKYSRSALPELDFLTQITFELYERNSQHNRKEYSIRMGFSPGAHDDHILDLHMDTEHCLKVAPRKNLTPFLSLDQALSYYRNAYLELPELSTIERQIEARKLYYAQEEDQ